MSGRTRTEGRQRTDTSTCNSTGFAPPQKSDVYPAAVYIMKTSSPCRAHYTNDTVYLIVVLVLHRIYNTSVNKYERSMYRYECLLSINITFITLDISTAATVSLYLSRYITRFHIDADYPFSNGFLLFV